jgi:hypothetical protein
MAFLLPSIYKPFYINVLFVRQSYTKFFVIIDIYNGIGLYNKENKQYHIGDIYVTLEGVGGTQRKETLNLNIYRDKFLFNTSYRESITTVFTSITTDIIESIGKSKKLIVEYKSPDNEYGIKINRDITLEVDLEFDDNITTSVKPFYLYHIKDNQYNICQDCNIDRVLKNRVMDKSKSKNFLYYVVNEGFYNYFIHPKCNYKSNSYIYKSYNGDEVETLNTDDKRINYDLNPYSVNYNDSNGGNFLPNENKYENYKDYNYCITMPFFRMYPSIASEPIKKISPFAVRLTSYGDGDSIRLEKDIEGYEVDEEKKFYLIGVKSPLTSLNETDYNNEYVNGGSLRPEQDYVTFIEYISEIDDKTEESYEYE